MILTDAAEVFYDGLLTLAYPQTCAVCGRSVEQRKYGVACEACWKATPIFDGAEAMCWKCGLPASAEISHEWRYQMRCRRCESQSFSAARAIGLYEGALRESVLLLKREPHLASHVEALLVPVARREPLNSCTRIVPVPLHPRRMRTRGFNQASVIAQALSKSLRLPLDEGSLVRVAAAEKYRAGLDSRGRQETVAGAFEVRYPRLVWNESILLIDDVFTTGATVSACAETLIAAGAREVKVLTLARARNRAR